MTTTTQNVPAEQAAAPWWRRLAAQGGFEARTLLRNAEQLMVTIALPVIALLALVHVTGISIGTTPGPRVAVVTPGVLTIAVMASAFTSQAIVIAFDRRNGVLRLLATTPLGRGGLVAGKVVAVLGILAGQLAVITAVALAVGWRPRPADLLLAVIPVITIAVCFTAMAAAAAGALRPEAVIAVANLLLAAFAGLGGLLPLDTLPGWLAAASHWLPSGAAGEAMRQVLLQHHLPLGSILVLLGWAGAAGAVAARRFSWD